MTRKDIVLCPTVWIAQNPTEMAKEKQSRRMAGIEKRNKEGK